MCISALLAFEASLVSPFDHALDKGIKDQPLSSTLTHAEQGKAGQGKIGTFVHVSSVILLSAFINRFTSLSGL